MRKYCDECLTNMKFYIRFIYSDFIYTFLFVSTVFINKYVLSVLKFTYPTVFQAWQTLVGVIVLKYLNSKKMLDVIPLDREAVYQLLPHCVFFVGAIVAGSKALSKLPVSVFVSVSNLPSICIFLLDYISGSSKASLVQLTAGLISLLATVSVIVLDINLPFADSGYLWLLAHITFIMAQMLHSRVTDPRYMEPDKLYYSNIFSVVVLAPSSFYLEEAFLVLHFQHRHQLRFYIGCLCSGILGACLQIWAIRLRSSNHTGTMARTVACLLSLPVFGPPAFLVWVVALLGLAAATMVPTSYILDEKNSNDPLVI